MTLRNPPCEGAPLREITGKTDIGDLSPCGPSGSSRRSWWKSWLIACRDRENEERRHVVRSGLPFGAPANPSFATSSRPGLAFVMRSRRLLAWMALNLVCVATRDDTSKHREATLNILGHQDCPPCSGLFSRLETNADGERTQQVAIQLYGEPKTGTTMMTTWGVGALFRTCDYLKDTYGQASCRTDPSMELSNNTTLIFQPGLASDDDPSCICDDVDMVRITLTVGQKHRLPVDTSCRWQHPPGLTKDKFACTTVKGRPVKDYSDIWACMQEASCDIKGADNKLQFASLRDPRAAAVSTYFHAVRGGRFSYMPDTVDEGTLRALPSVTQWIALRHILFEGLMANSSKTFWYEDAVGDPLDWHFRWTELAGLRLPIPWIKNITSLRLEGAWVDMTVGINPHPGGHDISSTRTWRDEVSPGIIEEMNAIVRTWLPGVLLARLGIPP